jgi:hypothetical protein
MSVILSAASALTWVTRPTDRRRRHAQPDLGAPAGDAARSGAAQAQRGEAGGEPAQVCARQPVIESFEPQAARRDALLQRYAHFRSLYPLLQESLRR